MSLSRHVLRAGVCAASLCAVTFCGIGVAQTAPPAPVNPRGDYALPRATDLALDAREARRLGVPIVLMFNLTGCHFCRGVLREVWQPMSKLTFAREGGAPSWAASAIYRQIDIDKSTPVADFSGNRTTHEKLAKFLKVDFTPTVWIVDAEGRHLAEPVIGISNFDFYAHYAEDRVSQAFAAMQARKQTQ